MSSFVGLRAVRQVKDSKSYVKSNKDIQQPSTTSSSQPSSNEGHLEKCVEAVHVLPPNVAVRSSSTCGRGLWTKIQHEPGDVLFSVKPHVAALSNHHLANHCSNCFESSSVAELKRCTSCRIVWYCSPGCQTKDWSLHKRECASLQEWSKQAPSAELSVPSDAVRCLGRILWNKQQRGLDSIWVKEIDAMQSHRASLQSSSFELHTHLSHALVRYLGLSSPQELTQFGMSSASDLVDLISRFVTNTFTVTSPSLDPIGASVSPIVALINHSCDPNAVVVFPRTSAFPAEAEPLMHVIALRSIEPNEEILTSYIDTTLPKNLRQKELQETYNFTCACKLCSCPPEVDPRESMWCPKSCGGTCPIPTEEDHCPRCTNCKAIVIHADAVLDSLRIGQEALEKATTLQSKDAAKSIQLTTNLVPILTSAGLAPSSHPLLALSRLHQSLLISSLPTPPTQNSLDEAIRAATRSSTGLSSTLCYGHPIRGIALANLGKLLAVDEPQPRHGQIQAAMYPPSGAPRLKLAYETLVRARNELLAGFGIQNEGGEAGRAVRESVVALEKELGVWKQGVRNVMEDTTGPAA